MDFKEIALKRQSCRAYNPDKAVEEEKIAEILEIARTGITGLGRGIANVTYLD